MAQRRWLTKKETTKEDRFIYTFIVIISLIIIMAAAGWYFNLGPDIKQP